MEDGPTATRQALHRATVQEAVWGDGILAGDWQARAGRDDRLPVECADSLRPFGACTRAMA